MILVRRGTQPGGGGRVAVAVARGDGAGIRPRGLGRAPQRVRIHACIRSDSLTRAAAGSCAPARTAGWVAGVAGGIAQRFGISPGLVRLLFVLSLLLPSPQILLYLAVWILVPRSRGRGRRRSRGARAHGSGEARSGSTPHPPRV